MIVALSTSHILIEERLAELFWGAEECVSSFTRRTAIRNRPQAVELHHSMP